MREQLKLVVNKYNLIEETQNGFWTNFNQYRKEEPNEFKQNFHDYSIEKLDIWIHSYSFGNRICRQHSWKIRSLL